MEWFVAIFAAIAIASLAVAIDLRRKLGNVRAALAVVSLLAEAETKRADDAEVQLFRLRTAPAEAAREAVRVERMATKLLLAQMKKRVGAAATLAEALQVVGDDCRAIESRG